MNSCLFNRIFLVLPVVRTSRSRTTWSALSSSRRSDVKELVSFWRILLMFHVDCVELFEAVFTFFFIQSASSSLHLVLDLLVQRCIPPGAEGLADAHAEKNDDDSGNDHHGDKENAYDESSVVGFLLGDVNPFDLDDFLDSFLSLVILLDNWLNELRNQIFLGY